MKTVRWIGSTTTAVSASTDCSVEVDSSVFSADENNVSEMSVDRTTGSSEEASAVDRSTAGLEGWMTSVVEEAVEEVFP